VLIASLQLAQNREPLGSGYGSKSQNEPTGDPFIRRGSQLKFRKHNASSATVKSDHFLHDQGATTCESMCRASPPRRSAAMHNIAITRRPLKLAAKDIAVAETLVAVPLCRVHHERLSTKSIAVEQPTSSARGKAESSRRHGEHIGVFPGFLSTAGDAQKRSTSWASRCIAAGSRSPVNQRPKSVVGKNRTLRSWEPEMGDRLR